MKEIREIVKAYKLAVQAGTKTALATVVHVEGSSYRRPGARMLVTETGEITGAISGGCLEGDALRKAMLAIQQQTNKIVTYDTNDEDDARLGVQLGCNGVIHILFEPIQSKAPDNPIALLEAVLEKRQVAVLVTLFSITDRAIKQPGTSLLFTSANLVRTSLSDTSLIQQLHTDAITALVDKQSVLKEYASCAGFIEVIRPAIMLVIAGAGNDTMPLAEMAKTLGWQVTIVDGRLAYASKKRFPQVDNLIVGKPEEVLPQLEIDDHYAFALMTHNYNYDLKTLELLLQKEVTYIGVLGPGKKLERMLNELEITSGCPANVYGPVGIDLGAETSEEIALSILAEIKAVFTGKQAQSLRNVRGAIHQRTQKHA